MSFDIRRMPADSFFHQEVPYVDSTGLLSFLRESSFQSHLLLVGPTGLAKTLSVYAWAQEQGYPVVEFSCSEEVRETHLIGSFGMEGDSTFFSLGVLPTALSVANEMYANKGEVADGAVLLLNEVNALSPQAQKMLNPMLDFQRTINAQAIGQSFQLDIGAKLWVVLTMNPNAYGGTYALNADLMRRVQPILLDYPTEEQEINVLTGLRLSAVADAAVGIPDEIFSMKVAGDHSFVRQLVKLAGDTRKGNLEYALSTSDLHQICKNVPIYGLNRALALSSNKFENEENRRFFVAKVQSTMGIDLGTVNILQPTSQPAKVKAAGRKKKRASRSKKAS